MLPVVERERSHTRIGVITDRDITIRHVAAGRPGATCQVREAMTADVTTCRGDVDMNDLMAMMGREQVRRIPVVDERSTLIGVVAQADIAREVGDTRATGQTLEQSSKP